MTCHDYCSSYYLLLGSGTRMEGGLVDVDMSSMAITHSADVFDGTKMIWTIKLITNTNTANNPRPNADDDKIGPETMHLQQTIEELPFPCLILNQLFLSLKGTLAWVIIIIGG